MDELFEKRPLSENESSSTPAQEPPAAQSEIPDATQELVLMEEALAMAEQGKIEQGGSASHEETALSTRPEAEPPQVHTKKGKKQAKLLPYKKLPAILRRTYSERALRTRLLRRIYIPQDRKDIAELFVKGANPKKPDYYAIPKELTYTKKAIKRYNRLAKEIKTQKKFVFKLIPFAAVIAAFAALDIFIVTFKNPIAKKLITTAFQTVFQAKTEIEYVNVSFISTSLTIRNIAVGNKDSVMKNLFEAEKMEMDFSLTQALRGRFHAQNLECSGMRFNTDRKTSCALEKGSGTFMDTPFMKQVKANSQKAIEDLQAMATEIFGGSDVESIVANVRENIKSPQAVMDAMAQSQELIDKWKEKPAELSEQVKSFAAKVQNLQTFNVKAFKVEKVEDIETLRIELQKVTDVIEESKAAKLYAEGLAAEVAEDARTVKKIGTDVSAAVKNDIDFATERLTTISGAIRNADKLFNDALEVVGYDMLGRYYPYVVKGINMAQEFKAQADAQAASKPKETKKKKEKAPSRTLKGKTYWFGTEAPKFLIEHALASGTGFKAEINEITNNPNIRYKPTTAQINLIIKDVDHMGLLVVDARRGSTKPLIQASYSGAGFTASMDGSRIAAKKGIPSIDGKALIQLSATAGSDGFTTTGSIKLDPLKLTTDGFENELVTKYYRQGLDCVNRLSLGYDIGFTSSRGVWLNLTGNFAEQFTEAVKTVAMNIGRDAKFAALRRLEKELNNSSNEVIVKGKEFLGIESDIDLQNMKLSDLQEIVEKKKLELEQRIKDEVKKASDAAKAEAKQKIQEADQKATDAVSGVIKEKLGTDSEASDAAAKALNQGAKSLIQGLTGKGSKNKDSD